MMSAQGGGGGTPKADAVRKLSKGGCVKKQIMGEAGRNIQKNCRHHMFMATTVRFLLDSLWGYSQPYSRALLFKRKCNTFSAL